MNNLAQAIRFAQLSHGNQRRKYVDEPYINHPVRVMQAVACDSKFGGNEEISIAAILHDVIEDTDIKNLYVESWGENVLKWVGELTNKFTKEAYPAMNRRQRKAAELERLTNISLEAKVIKLYDRLDNLKSWFAPGIYWTDEMKRFGRIYARESWEMVWAIADPQLFHITTEVFPWTAKLRDHCSPTR